MWFVVLWGGGVSNFESIVFQYLDRRTLLIFTNKCVLSYMVICEMHERVVTLQCEKKSSARSKVELLKPFFTHPFL